MGKIDYMVGFDPGTNSIGWAVTDKNYNLIRYKGKDLWGIHEFEEAETKADRRANRNSRTRRRREIARIGLLKDLFHDELEKVDPNFLIRLENSMYHKEDKSQVLQGSKYGLFNDDNFNDKDYFTQYPTIFHLRSALINNEEKAFDIRLLFLAILNMYKHRGHFLSSGNLDEMSSKDIYNLMIFSLDSELSIKLKSDISFDEILDILSDSKTSKTYKKEKLLEYYKVDKKRKREIEVIKGICGLTFNAKVLFEDIESDEKVGIDFSDYSYEDKIDELISTIGDDNYYVVELMKNFYDAVILSKTLQGEDYLSKARVKLYNQHKSDLKLLKDVYRKYLSSEQYNHMFRSKEKDTYSSYVNSYNTNGEKNSRDYNGSSNRSRVGLYASIKKDVKNIEFEGKQYILDAIANETFLPKQLTASNGVIPNQVHKKEMVKILENAKEYFGFLSEKDESGLSVAEKIIALFEFQIPYYVGHLGKNSKTGWVVRRDNYSRKVLPWNIEEIVDMKKTSQAFVERMIRRCTYISNENVHALPKNSLMYQTFSVLNEINNIKLDSISITPKLKQELYNQVYLNNKSVTKKKIINFFIAKGLIKDDKSLSGIDTKVTNQLSSYHKFKAILGDRINNDNYKHMVEDIIFWITIYGDKKLVKEEIEEHYSELLTPNDIKKILALKFKDWGRLSKEFLELNGTNKATGEYYSIIRMMWETNDNLMQLLSNFNYTYLEELEKQQKKAYKSLAEFSYDDLNDLYFSAPVKRMVWRVILLLKEIEEIMGYPPYKIFVETTREHQEIGRTTSRKEKFLKLYQNIKDEEIDWQELISSADSSGKLKTKKMYLYLTQKGRCMYTNEIIELKDLFDDNLYDIDHIYPRQFVKDDNINTNLVLVKKEKNNHKQNYYPIEKSIKEQCKSLWKELLNEDLITQEKYNRLISNESLTDEQKAGFIARQLVETSQAVKGITNILKRILPEETKIIPTKASNTSEFRHNYDLYKSRVLNDFHHAHDAYLSIVIGNVYYTKFTTNPMNFIKNYKRDPEKYHYNLDKMYKWDVARNGEVAWIASVKDGSTGTIEVVKNTLKKNNPLMTKMCFEKNGEITNATICSHKHFEGALPVKSSNVILQDTSKYGGRKGIAIAYYFLVEHTKGKKRVRTIEGLPVYLKEQVKGDAQYILNYCVDKLGLNDPLLLISKIRIKSLIKYNGYFLYITGVTGNQFIVCNAVNLVLDSYWNKYIHKIEKCVDYQNVDKDLNAADNIKLYDVLVEKHLNTIYAKKPNPIGKKLLDKRNKFIELDTALQCKVLYEILNISKIGSNKTDLSLIGGSKNDGAARMNKNITDAKECKLIHQSITGVYERTIDLLSDELADSRHIK